jgi:hypothetical protein
VLKNWYLKIIQTLEGSSENNPAHSITPATSGEKSVPTTKRSFMASQRTNITTPVGRVVRGSLYTPNTKDFDGKPLVVKTGANIGQPRSDFFFALAIPKGAEQHWAQTTWGAEIWRVGHTAFPQAAQSPTFAWKIDDGDSAVPNKKGRKPCDNEGWKGHWILKFSGGFAPKVYREENGVYVQVTEDDYLKPGYFAQVLCSVDGNGNQNNPGIYLNHSMVCFRAFGPEITFGPDVNDAGFGQAPLPAGATLTPPPSTIPMPAAGTPALPSAPAAIPAPIAPIPVTPNPAFLQVPTAVPNPSLPAVPAAIAAVQIPTAIPVVPMPASPSSGPQMTAKAQGSSYQAFISAGWTDANLIAQGYMTV